MAATGRHKFPVSSDPFMKQAFKRASRTQHRNDTLQVQKYNCDYSYSILRIFNVMSCEWEGRYSLDIIY